MPPRTLTLRDLNRATLSRQLLLDRASLPIPEAIERLVGLQAQLPMAPYVGLWTRLAHFERDDLAHLINDHTVIKATLMRATLHLCTARDYLFLRPTLQPVLAGASETITKHFDTDFDLDKVLKAARSYLSEEPRTFAELTSMLTDLVPGAEPGPMRYAVRTQIPLVQVPTDTRWSYPGNPKFTLAESWLGKTIPTESTHASLRDLVFRYLAAFGPASVQDMQTWSGIPKLKEHIEKLKPDLQVYRDEKGRELLDLPDISLVDAATPAPERFLPEFDNLLLSHTNRTRIVADEYRPQVYLPALRVAATFLVDGFVRGAWKVDKAKSAATLTITPFAPITKQNRAALTEQAEALVRFIEPNANSHEVRFAD